MRHNYISWQKTFLVYYFGCFYLLKNNLWVKSVFFEKCSAFDHYTVKNRKKSTFFLRASKKGVIYVLFKNRTSCDPKGGSLSKKFFGSVEHIFTILWKGLGGKPDSPPIFSQHKFHSKCRKAGGGELFGKFRYVLDIKEEMETHTHDLNDVLWNFCKKIWTI